MSEKATTPIKKPPRRRPPRSRLRGEQAVKWVPTTPTAADKKETEQKGDHGIPDKPKARTPKERAKTPRVGKSKAAREFSKADKDKASTPRPRRPPQTAAARRFSSGGVLQALRSEDRKMDFLSQLQKSFSAATGGGSEDEDEQSEDLPISVEEINELLNKKSGHVKLSELKRAIRERNSPSNRMQVQENLRRMFSNNSGIGSEGAKPQLARDILLGSFEKEEPSKSPIAMSPTALSMPENINSLSELEQLKIKLKQTIAQASGIEKQLEAAKEARQNDMSSLRESFTLLNKRLQQQLGHLGTENTKLNGSLTIVNEKNSKLQERLSVIGERNLAITSEFDILRKLEEAEAAETTPLSLEQEQEEMMAAVVSHGASFSYPQGGYKDQQASTSWADMSDPKAFDPLNSDLVSLAQTFHGSRLIQAKLDDESDENKFFFECFFNQCKNRTYEIMTNKFGRFAFEKMLEKCDDDQRLLILKSLTHSLTAVACDTHGSFGTQVLIKSLTTDQQIDLAAHILLPQTLVLVTDYKGHYLVVVLISQFPYEKFSFIDEVIIAHCAAVSMNNQGLQVVKAIFQHRTPAQLNPLLQVIAANAIILVENQYGNYVVQQALVYPMSVEEAHSKANPPGKHNDKPKSTNPDIRQWEAQNQKLQQMMIRSLEGNFRRLSMQKFSSNVVEVILLRHGHQKWTKIIVKELIASPPTAVRTLVSDRFGNYVLQTALNVCTSKLVQTATDRILPHLPSFRLNLRNKWFKILQTARARVGLPELSQGADGPDEPKAKVIVSGSGNGKKKEERS